MKLLFQNSQGKEKVIAEVENADKAMVEIKKFCAERDYKIPYVRYWEHMGDNGKKRGIWDCGSHSEFFLIDLE